MSSKVASTLRRSGKRTTGTGNLMSVYDYALRCAIRAWQEQESQSVPISSKKDKRISGHPGLGDMLTSLTDKFGDDSKSQKVTKELMKSLERRMDSICKEKDSSRALYRDKQFLAALGSFQKFVSKQRSNPHSNVHELVFVFAETSKTELGRTDPNPATWFNKLNDFMECFEELLISTIKDSEPSLNTPEVMEKLSIYSNSKNRRPSSATSNSGAKNTETSAEDSLAEFPMVKLLQVLFKVDRENHRAKLRELNDVCTEAAFVQDLKRCLDNIHTQQHFPGRREDFPDQQCYDQWKRRETKQLTELMNSLLRLNPSLVSATSGAEAPRPPVPDHGRVSSLQRTSSIQNPFTFIPKDPRNYYRILADVCMEYNVTNETDRAKGSVFSHKSDELLRECWRTWRLSSPYRSILYLELVKVRFDCNELGLEDMQDATRALEKVMKEAEPTTWSIKDASRESLVRVFEGMNQSLLQVLANEFQQYWCIRSDWVEEIVGLLDHVYENPVYREDHENPLSEWHNLEEIVEGSAIERWRTMEEAASKVEMDDVSNLIMVADKLIKEFSSITKGSLKEPIKGIISVPSIVMSRQMPYFTLMIQNWAISPKSVEEPINVVFDLYQRVLTLKHFYDQYGPQKSAALFKVESWFLRHVRRWITVTSRSTPEWVENAVKQDNFTRTSDTVTHSSSVVDLFAMFHQAADFVDNLQWPNERQHCGLLTALSKVVGVGLDQYTSNLSQQIKYDIQGEPERKMTDTEYHINSVRALFGRSSSAQGDMFANLTPEICVRLSNIEAARTRLDRLYQAMNADAVAEIMQEYTPTAEATEQTNFLYTVEVMRAEHLQPLDKNGLSDPYVVLQYNENTIAQTRTVYKTLNPYWNQAFEVRFSERKVDILALVYDEDVIGVNEECGAAWFSLSEELFGDYMVHVLNLKLKPQGVLRLRIRMAGEKDDIQFWFGKAFRTLKYAENDVGDLIAQHLSKCMRKHLSRQSLCKLFKRDHSNVFSALPIFGKSSTPQADIALQECEDVIEPLITYLENNLKTLNDNLSEPMMRMIVLKIWQEVLSTLENLLLPPLSEHPATEPALDDQETHVVFQWLLLLKILFNGGESGDGVPLEKLQNSQYESLLTIKSAYEKTTAELINGFNMVLRNEAEIKKRGGRKTDRSKSVYRSKNMAHKQGTARRGIAEDAPSSDTILRILRMRPEKEARIFLHDEFEKRYNPSSPQDPVPV